MSQYNFSYLNRYIKIYVNILASMAFLGDSQPTGRKALAVYPIFLFYFVISWLVISHTT